MNGLIHVYIPNAECNHNKIKIAIDIIDSLSAKLESIANTSEDDFSISREELDEIMEEYKHFAAHKIQMIDLIKTVTKQLTEKLEDIRPCLSCHQGCLDRLAHGLPISCAVNPACGRERSLAITPAIVIKNVLIVGGGLAGMEAARVCAIRGHKVTLLEKGTQLGGNIIPGSVPDFKEDDRALLKWYEVQLAKLPVEIRFGCEADPEMIEKSMADVVIFATGPLLYEALKAAKELEHEVQTVVINIASIKPIDKDAIVAAVKEAGAVVTVEEHQVAGGMGSAIAELVAAECPAPVEFVGVHDMFGQSGTPTELNEHYKLSAPHIIEAARRVLTRK